MNTMKENKLFLIIKKNGKTKEPIASFLEGNFEKAKEYFYGYIYGERDYINYELKWIGTIIDNKIRTTNIFITGGYEVAQEQNEINKIKKQKQLNFIFNKNTKFEEKLKTLFNGEYIGYDYE